MENLLHVGLDVGSTTVIQYIEIIKDTFLIPKIQYVMY